MHLAVIPLTEDNKSLAQRRSKSFEWGNHECLRVLAGGLAVADYVFDSAENVLSEHLFNIEQALDPVSLARLHECGVRSGWKCLEIGGGAGSVARWLSDRVGKHGRVVVWDTDTRWLTWLEGCGNVLVQQRDVVSEPLPEAEYDLIHARLVLILLPERRKVLGQLVRALKPGGVLLLEDFDVSGTQALAAPSAEDAEVFDRTLGAFLRALEASGVDTQWGRHAYAELRAAGLVDVSMTGYVTDWQGKSAGSQLLRINFTQLKTKVLSSGGVTEEEFQRACALLDDENFVTRSFVVVANSGVRPENATASEPAQAPRSAPVVRPGRS